MDNDEMREQIYEFLKRKKGELVFASTNEKPLILEYFEFDKYNPDLADNLLEKPEEMFELIDETLKDFELPNEVGVQFRNLPEKRGIRIRDLGTKQLNSFLNVEHPRYGIKTLQKIA